MKTAVINVKTTPLIKTRAQKMAKELGFGLSTLINAFLNQLVKDRRVEFRADAKEEPSEWMIKSLKEAEKGPFSPIFDDADEAIKWLDNEAKKYRN